ncbi:MAG: hypothetical protein ACRD4U_10310 [Candidatus Acidiferrales bacterium]
MRHELRLALVGFILAVMAPPVAGQAGRTEGPVRYRVEQVLRLETLSVEERPAPGRLPPEPVRTSVRGRLMMVLEQKPEPGQPGRGAWRFTQVEIEPPQTEPAGRADAGVERVFILAMEWMKRLEGQEFSGSLSELPVLPLGEPAPPWLASWLRWAQTGAFSGLEGDPAEVAAAVPDNPVPVSYQLNWLRSEFRRVPCHVQQARWAVPVTPATDSLPPSLAAEGVEAHTHFAAQSLEWVSQENATLLYAERSGVRETFWSLAGVEKPELKELVFRLRLAVEVRVERLP